VRPSLDAISPPVNPGCTPVRPPVTSDAHPAATGHLPVPPSRRPLAEIIADPTLSSGAKLLARCYDGYCEAFGKWAAWPSALRVAEKLGWISGEPGAYPTTEDRHRAERAARKRFERCNRELFDTGDVARPRLGDLVAWYDATGAGTGFDWPKGLRRTLCRSATITVLGWKLAEAEERLPSLTACDIPVASSGPTEATPAPPNVACDATNMSHTPATKMSHPQNSLSSNVPSELTYDDVAAFAEGEGEPPMPTEPVAIVEAQPAPAPPPLWTPRELAEKLFLRLRNRGVILKLGHDPERGEVICPHRQAEHIEPIRPDEVEELLRLRPHVLAFLKGEPPPRAEVSTPSAATASPDAKPTAAPKVRRDARDDVKRRLGGLTLSSTNPEVLATAKALAAALGPHADPDATERTYLLWCGKARSGAGSMSRAILLDAFERACDHKTARCRGAVFNATVEAFIAQERRRALPPA
jgi:hypothetical protein